MKPKINNIDDLRTELIRLRLQRVEYENDFKMEVDKVTDKFRYPIILIKKVNDWFSSFGEKEGKEGKDHDWISNAFRIGLPVLANRFFFPKSGIIMKSIVELVTQKASKTVNKDLFNDLINKVSHWIKPDKVSHGRKRVLHDYGIPPDSETY